MKNISRRNALLLSTALLAGAALPAWSAEPAAPHFVTLSTPLTAQAAKGEIDVVEMFWYGCPHCDAFETPLKAWIARQPKDVKVRRIPGVMTEMWEPAAQLYYTLESLGQHERLHAQIFDAEHREGSLQVASRNETKYADWAAQRGVDRAAFLTAWKSDAVAEKIKQAKGLVKELKARKIGVPLIVVDGRLVTNAGMTGDHDDTLKMADQLIARVRAEHAKK